MFRFSIVVRGFRQMAGGEVNPGLHAGVQYADTIEQVNGERITSFQDGIAKLKAVPVPGTLTLTLRRQPEA